MQIAAELQVMVENVERKQLVNNLTGTIKADMPKPITQYNQPAEVFFCVDPSEGFSPPLILQYGCVSTVNMNVKAIEHVWCSDRTAYPSKCQSFHSKCGVS